MSVVPFYRPRRLRVSPAIREAVAETRLHSDQFVYPYFIVPGKNQKEPIVSMPGIHHWSTDTLLQDLEIGLKRGIRNILLFGTGEEKSANAASAYAKDNLVARTVQAIKEHFGPEIYVITDVCVCAYTTHGHCGIIKGDQVDNDASLEILGKMALSHARAGADMVAPSDMMDGRIAHIRDVLDADGLTGTALMSYAIKYASAYYGPFRDAADSAPGKGDRKGYQMDFRNPRESMKEAFLDEQEGADVLMVKPALAYLDVLYRLRQETNLPLACYNVSGEFSMVKQAAKAGLIDEERIVMENMHAFVRAGAQMIITYHARDIVENGWI